LEIVKQVSVHPLARIKRFAVCMEVLTRFDRQDEGPEFLIDTVQTLDESVMLSPRALSISWESQAGVYVCLGRSDEYENGGNTLIPK